MGDFVVFITLDYCCSDDGTVKKTAPAVVPGPSV
jgi:hypothetical protein